MEAWLIVTGRWEHYGSPMWDASTCKVITEKFGVTPDMVTLAKALGGGFPVGAIGVTPDDLLLKLRGE
jgi:hypothetical protein